VRSIWPLAIHTGNANAASVSGYDQAKVDGDTEDLFKGRQDIIDANTVSLNIGKHPSRV